MNHLTIGSLDSFPYFLESFIQYEHVILTHLDLAHGLLVLLFSVLEQILSLVDQAAQTALLGHLRDTGRTEGSLAPPSEAVPKSQVMALAPSLSTNSS